MHRCFLSLCGEWHQVPAAQHQGEAEWEIEIEMTRGTLKCNGSGFFPPKFQASLDSDLDCINLVLDQSRVYNSQKGTLQSIHTEGLTARAVSIRRG